MRTNLAQMIEKAVEDCIVSGRGYVYDENDETNEIIVAADWAENEEDIEVAIFEGGILRLAFTEKYRV